MAALCAALEPALAARRTGSVTLSDGSVVAVHPMDPQDAGGLLDFHRHLSRESIRRRFFTVHPELSEDELERFTRVDHEHREAIVATVADEIVGIARYDQVGDEPVAEVAFVVADAWQGRGLGTALFELLAEHALDHGIVRFTAETFADNTRMIRVLRHCGRPSRFNIDYGVATVDVDLTDA